MGKLRLASAVDPANAGIIALLEQRMRDYYTHNPAYYDNIAFTADAWKTEPAYRWLHERLPAEGPLLEMGCGEAFILRSYPELASRYTGVDHSPELVARNNSRYSPAKFLTLDHFRRSPFSDGAFQAVLAVWVLEHVVRPHLFLDECARLLAPGGVLLLLTPNLLGENGCGSDRYGLPNHVYGQTAGDVRAKMKAGRWLDAVSTWFDSRWRTPAILASARSASASGYGFFVNTNPSCFSVPFQPDTDAVYMTLEPEIRRRLGASFVFDSSLPQNSLRQHILLCGRKVVPPARPSSHSTPASHDCLRSHQLP